MSFRYKNLQSAVANGQVPGLVRCEPVDDNMLDALQLNHFSPSVFLCIELLGWVTKQISRSVLLHPRFPQFSPCCGRTGTLTWLSLPSRDCSKALTASPQLDFGTADLNACRPLSMN